MTSSHDRTAAGSLPLKAHVYVSRPAPGLALDAVHTLVIRARITNALDGLHGLLTYDRRGFLQVLEGTAEAVDATLARIRCDQRHYAVRPLFDEPVPGPMFHSFIDLVQEDDVPAGLHLLHPRSVARLSPAVARAIAQGYALLDEPI